MAKKQSAGLLLYRLRPGIEVFLVHPGGPYWAKKDEGSWSIPKGEFEEGDDPLEAARRELREETGFSVEGDLARLDPVKQAGGKTVNAWMVEADLDPDELVSNTFEMEWPPRSGKIRQFPEVDRASWFSLEEARKRILKGQMPLINQLEARVLKEERGR